MEKSPWTCRRCKYFVQECMGKKCKDCPMYLDVHCKCVEIRNGQDCPYFVPAKDKLEEVKE